MRSRSGTRGSQVGILPVNGHTDARCADPSHSRHGRKEHLEGAARAFLRLDLSVLPELCALGFGILAGIGLSIHAIRAALKKYRPQMVWLIPGLMAGSLCAIVMGPASLDVPQAPVGLQSFDLLGFALGIAVLLGLEALRKWTAQQASSKAMPEKRTVT